MIRTSVTITHVLALMQDISLQPVVQEQLHSILTPDFCAQSSAAMAALTDPAASSHSWKSLEEQWSPEGLRLLAVYLLAACLTRAQYRSAGVPESVFMDTMSCFPRYLQDEYDCTGRWIFTRGFWAWRHLCCRMFRLGTLEFEYVLPVTEDLLTEGIEPGTPVLYVHIPSDASLKDEELQLSYSMAVNFFKGSGVSFCPAGVPRAMLCHTWLLSPELQTLLHPSSGIRRFARDYRVYATDPEDDSFYRWLYQGKKPPQPLPLETSLQRTVSKHLLKGGTIGAAHGLQTTWKIM